MRRTASLVTLLGLAMVACTPTTPPAGTTASPAASKAPASPAASKAPASAASASASPTATASTVGTASGAPIPGPTATRLVDKGEVAVPITATLMVDGQPATIDPTASYHLAPGSTSSVFWDIGVYAKTPGSTPVGALKAGDFACTLHVAGINDFIYDVRTLTEKEFITAAKFTLREGVVDDKSKILIAREWYVQNNTPGANATGSFAVVDGKVEFSLKATMPADKYNGKPHTLDLSVKGLPKP